MIPLVNYKNFVNEEKLKNTHNKFLKKLITLFSETFNNELDIKTIDMQEQLETTSLILNSKRTISLDTYYRGTYDIETSRLFDISDIQKKYISLIGRIGHDTIEHQIERIKDVNERIFDIVDLRDFIIGVQNGGLVVRLPNGEIARAPYMLPYVSLKSRATIPAIKEMEFSIKLWEMNKEFYQEIGGNITLKQTDNGFKKLMNYIGFDDNTLIVDICDWHINKLKLE